MIFYFQTLKKIKKQLNNNNILRISLSILQAKIKKKTLMSLILKSFLYLKAKMKRINNKLKETKNNFNRHIRNSILKEISKQTKEI